MIHSCGLPWSTLHKRPAVDVTDVTLALRPQQIEAAHVLLEGHDHLDGIRIENIDNLQQETKPGRERERDNP